MTMTNIIAFVKAHMKQIFAIVLMVMLGITMMGVVNSHSDIEDYCVAIADRHGLTGEHPTITQRSSHDKFNFEIGGYDDIRYHYEVNDGDQSVSIDWQEEYDPYVNKVGAHTAWIIAFGFMMFILMAAMAYQYTAYAEKNRWTAKKIGPYMRACRFFASNMIIITKVWAAVVLLYGFGHYTLLTQNPIPMIGIGFVIGFIYLLVKID